MDPKQEVPYPLPPETLYPPPPPEPYAPPPPQPSYTQKPASYTQPASSYAQQPTPYPPPPPPHSQQPAPYKQPPAFYQQPTATYTKPPATYTQPPASHPPPPNPFDKQLKPGKEHHPPSPGHAPEYPEPPPPVSAKTSAGATTVAPAAVQNSHVESDHRVRYFLVAMVLGFFLGILAFIPLCCVDSLKRSPRKRKYFIFGVCLGIVMAAFILALIFLRPVLQQGTGKSPVPVNGTLGTF